MKSKRKLNILVSNDDGIDAPGIYALVQEMKKIGNVTVVAPDKQQSAVGHAITMNYPLRVKEFKKNGKFFGYAVQGTPADCVKLAVRAILKRAPDLVVQPRLQYRYQHNLLRNSFGGNRRNNPWYSIHCSLAHNICTGRFSLSCTVSTKVSSAHW
jgi:hypothetical protein